MISPDDFIRICQDISLRVEDALSSLVGTKYGAEELCMGADNTPTERMDKIAEDIIIEELRKARVSHYILSEEAGMIDIGGDSGIVFLDPIDGSYNAGAGIPFYALSVGLSDGSKIIAGYVRNLANHETFTAIRGKGAYLNGNPIKPECKSSLEKATMCVYARPRDLNLLLNNGYTCRKTRIFGAAALELCYVACGRIDGFLDIRGTLRITDVAAALLLLEEVGCITSLPDGGNIAFPDDVKYGCCLLATNKELHSQIIAIMRSL